MIKSSWNTDRIASASIRKPSKRRAAGPQYAYAQVRGGTTVELRGVRDNIRFAKSFGDKVASARVSSDRRELRVELANGTTCRFDARDGRLLEKTVPAGVLPEPFDNHSAAYAA